MRGLFVSVHRRGRSVRRCFCRSARAGLILACALAIAFAGLVPSPAGAAEPVPQATDKPAEPAVVDGFRSARFGMSEDQVRQAIQKDFPAVAQKLKAGTHPTEKTTVLTLTVTDLLPNSGPARLDYVLGYKSKKLVQVSVGWASEHTAASDEAVVATANTLREYFAAQGWKPETVVANRQVSEHAITVFKAVDQQGRAVYLRLNGAAANAPKNDKAPRPPPLTLDLSYIADPANPDVFTIAKGQF